LKQNSNGAVQRGDYYYFSTITTRWKDNDIYGHVNNVIYYSYFDTAANNYLIERGGFDIKQPTVVGFVVASSCEYHAPISHPQDIEVGFRVNTLGSKSVEYGLAIFKAGEQQACANGTFTHVFVELASGKSTLIPSQLRAALETAIVS